MLQSKPKFNGCVCKQPRGDGPLQRFRGLDQRDPTGITSRFTRFTSIRRMILSFDICGTSLNLFLKGIYSCFRHFSFDVLEFGIAALQIAYEEFLQLFSSVVQYMLSSLERGSRAIRISRREASCFIRESRRPRRNTTIARTFITSKPWKVNT